MVENNTTLTCLAPPVESTQAILIYSLKLDGVLFNGTSDPNFIIAVKPSPSDFVLVNSEPIAIQSVSVVIHIQVRYLATICDVFQLLSYNNRQ